MLTGKLGCRDGRSRGAGLRGCWGIVLIVAASAGAGEQPVAVAVSIAPQAWLVEQVGGERVAVTTLVEPGASPATYQPSDAQVSRLMRSAVYFRIGAPCERGPWFDAIRSSRRVEIVDLREGVGLRFLPRHRHGVEAGHGRGPADPPRIADHELTRGNPSHPRGEDPHVWLSPTRLKIQARTIATTLARIDPASGAGYRRRLGRFEEHLDVLDRELRQRLRPFSGRSFLVFHPAWGYFAADYSLRQLTLEIEGKGPTEAEMTELQKLARQEGIRVVFVQPQIRGRAAEAVAVAIAGHTEVLDPLAADVSTNLRSVAERIAASFERPR